MLDAEVDIGKLDQTNRVGDSIPPSETARAERSRTLARNNVGVAIAGYDDRLPRGGLDNDRPVLGCAAGGEG
jgi:hypothetical protein